MDEGRDSASSRKSWDAENKNPRWDGGKCVIVHKKQCLCYELVSVGNKISLLFVNKFNNSL